MPVPPRLPTGQELYDAIMGHIDSDLTTANVQEMSKPQSGETPEQVEARKKRYTLAFERYEQAYEGYMATLHEQVTRYCVQARRQAEVNDRTQEAGILDQLSSSFLQAV